MRKIITSVIILSSGLCFSQISGLEIITKQNDTIKDIVLKNSKISNPTKSYKFQNEVVYLNKEMKKVKMLPSEVKSFSFKYNNELITYESKQDEIFALVMYSNKIKLLRFQKRGYTPVDIYVIERPNGKTSYLEATGLSRRISLNVIKRELPDCPATIENVVNNTLKIHGEPGILELILDYETNCY